MRNILFAWSRDRNAVRSSRATVAVAVVMTLGVLQVASAQQSEHATRSVVVLTRLTAPSGDTVARNLAATITQSVGLVLRLTGKVTVRRADFLTPTVSLNRAVEYYRQIGAVESVFGSVTPTPDGNYSVSLAVWKASVPGGKPLLMRSTVTNLLGSFALSDRLAVRVASAVVGRTLSEGTLAIANAKLLKRYAVYADGHLLGRNKPTLRVLTGEREVVVAKPGLLGDVPVEVFHVDIRTDRTTTVTLELPRRSPETTAGALKAGSSPPATGIAHITSRSAAYLFVDGRERTHLAPGQETTITALALGHHRFEVRYPDGRIESTDATFSPSSRQVNVVFGYRPHPTTAVHGTPAPATRPAPPRIYGGLDIGQAVLISELSSSLSKSLSFYLPVEANFTFALRKHFGVATEVLYRYERDGVSFATQEIAAGIGPAWLSNGLDGFFVTARAGLGYAAGTDYAGTSYTRLDLLLEPEAGLLLPLADHLALRFGLGLQSLLRLTESPPGSATWNSLGLMSHYYLPMFDASVGAEF